MSSDPAPFIERISFSGSSNASPTSFIARRLYDEKWEEERTTAKGKIARRTFLT